MLGAGAGDDVEIGNIGDEADAVVGTVVAEGFGFGVGIDVQVI